jgi:hypothetical protein
MKSGMVTDRSRSWKSLRSCSTIRISSPLLPEAVLQRRDDAAAVGVVLRVGAGHDVDIDRQAELEPADLHVALLDQVQQPDLDPLGQVRKLVDGEDPAVGTRHQAVVDR